jgi:RNA polymerase sigma-70 factor (ECF subfamily)
MGAAALVRGRTGVAEVFNGGARSARLAVLGADAAGGIGEVGAVWTLRGEPKVAFSFTVVGERVTGIELIADPEWLTTTEFTYLREPRPGEAPGAS